MGMMGNVLPLLMGWGLDKCLGDPSCLPHPVVAFGRWIGFVERHANKGRCRRAKGTFLVGFSVAGVYGYRP